MRLRGLFVVVLPLLLGIPLIAGDMPFRYPRGKHGKGELRFVSDLPVLCVEGTPEEIGEQVAMLGSKPAPKLMGYPKDAITHLGLGVAWKPMLRMCKELLPQVPTDHRKEMEAMVQTGLDADLILAANTMFDVKKMIACSAVVVDPKRSSNGEPLMGRNLDFLTLGYLQEYSIVTVFKPQGKHAFAAVGFPGIVGCLSGMNDAGLCLAVLEVHFSNDSSMKYDKSGVPYAMNYRRVLEECTTVDEAEKLLSSLKQTTRTNLAICDRKGGAIFEITPKNVVRRSGNGATFCTNHFCSKLLEPKTQLNWFHTFERYETLAQRMDKLDKLDVHDIDKCLDAVNLGEHTLQTMVFEPVPLRLHLAIGECPSSALRMKVLELGPLFAAMKQAGSR